MISQNMHIHSKYSWDSKMEIEEIARILFENGIKYGALTDHVEFDREPLMQVLAKFKIRNLEIDQINEKYEGKVKLLKAVEISEPHLYKDQVNALKELELDFLMGSIHRIDRKAETDVEKRNAFRLYYQELLKMVEANQIDVVGHLDYINKYYEKDYQDVHQVFEVIQAIKENNQIIEINTSGARRNNSNTFPSLEKICTYMMRDQREIMIGTDAHRYNELLDNLSQTEIITETLSLKPVIYEKRKRIII